MKEICYYIRVYIIMNKKELREVEIILDELTESLHFFTDRKRRLIAGEQVAINTYHNCSNEVAYMCPKCGAWAGDISEYEEYQDNKVPLEKDALCSKCK